MEEKKIVTLSSKWDSECGDDPEWRVYPEKDVKDFIKAIKEKCNISFTDWKIINEIAGDELI